MKDPFSSCVVLVNPSRYPARAKRLIRMLRRIEAPRIVVSKNEFEFTQSVRDFIRSDDTHLLIFGGDGTIHRALNELMPKLLENGRAHTKSIGFFRGGSGNGYHDSYVIPLTMRKQLSAFAESIRCDRSIPVDIMEIKQGSQLRYGQLFGTGFDADVLKRRNAWLVDAGARKKPRPGLLNYIRAALMTFRRLEIRPAANPVDHPSEEDGKGSIKVVIRKENSVSEVTLHSRAPMIEIGKRPFFGSRFRVCPGAEPSDGPMELIQFDFKRKDAVILNLFPLWMGWHGLINRICGNNEDTPIKRHEADSCAVSVEKPLDYHVDGELVSQGSGSTGTRTVRITVLRRAVRFIVPRRYLLQHGKGSGKLPGSTRGTGEGRR